MRLQTLGALRLEGHPTARRKPLLLLTYLAIEGPQERRHVAQLFWRNAQDPAASLRVALSQLRRLDASLIHAEGGRLWTDVRTDAHEIVSALERGRIDALERFRGPFLHGVDGPAIDGELREWILATREYAAARIRHALLLLAEEFGRRGELGTVRMLSERAVDVGPLEDMAPERLPRLHALLARSGSPSARRVEKLAREYDLDIGGGEASARSNDLPWGFTVGLAGSGPTFAGGPFVGRDREVTDVEAHLAEPDARVVTILGGAGTGKTRLALEVARRQRVARRYEDGVHVVDLSDVTDSGELPDRIARRLGMVVQARADEPEQLVRMLQARDLLLVLDNVEHLRNDLRLVSAIADACPRVTILLTSRERVREADPQVVLLRGLPYPEEEVIDRESAQRYEAVQLFLLRALYAHGSARWSDAQVPAVQRICRAVAGVPLGIELAAAWTRVLPVDEVARELEHGLELLDEGPRALPERHRGLRAAFEHSWTLLGEDQRRALRRLAVFRGGFTRPAASEVADVTLAQLARLVDAFMLTLGEDGRYRRHPFVANYAEEKLAQDPEELAEMRARHGRYVLETVARLFPDVTSGPDARVALDRIETEEANVSVAWTWALEARAWPELFDALAVAGAYTEFRGRFHFAHGLARRVLDHVQAGDAGSRRLVSLAHAVHGFAVLRAAEPARVQADAEAAVASLPPFDPEDPGTVYLTWWAWHLSACGAVVVGDVEANVRNSERALEALEAALATEEAEGPRRVHTVMAGVSRHLLTQAAFQEGDLDTSERHLEAQRVLFASVDSHARSYAIIDEAQLLLAKGAFFAASRLLREGLELVQSLRKPIDTADILVLLAKAQFGLGHVDEADAVCSEAVRIASDVGAVFVAISSQALEGRIALARGDATEAAAWFARCFALAETYGLYGYGMEAVSGRAELLARRDRIEPALRLLRFVVGFEPTPDWIRAEARARLAELTAGARDAARSADADELTLEDVRRAMVPG